MREPRTNPEFIGHGPHMVSDEIRGRKKHHSDDAVWENFKRKWNSWPDKTKKEYLYYLSTHDGRLLRWFVVGAFVLGLLIGAQWLG